MLGVEHAVIESIELLGQSAAEVLVVSVRPTRLRRSRCSRCDHRCWGLRPGARPAALTDAGPRDGLGLSGGQRASIVLPGARVVVAVVPWPRAGARHTAAFEDTGAWLAAHTAGARLAGCDLPCRLHGRAVQAWRRGHTDGAQRGELETQIVRPKPADEYAGTGAYGAVRGACRFGAKVAVVGCARNPSAGPPAPRAARPSARQRGSSNLRGNDTILQ